MISWNKS